jgi:hypothetical protein
VRAAPEEAHLLLETALLVSARVLELMRPWSLLPAQE